MKVYAIIPARSGSKGVPDKNIKNLDGHPLMAYSIAAALKLGVDRVFCSTDSMEYAEIAGNYAAEVPFLRSAKASMDTAMEEDILEDLDQCFDKHEISKPDLYVWLRPTFVLRDLDAIQRCIDRLANDPSLTACRTVVESESRLYQLVDHSLTPTFDDHGRSMARRQDQPVGYKVYSTDVFRAKNNGPGSDFLGRKIGAEVVDKMCGLDIDDEADFDLINHLVVHDFPRIKPYLHKPTHLQTNS